MRDGRLLCLAVTALGVGCGLAAAGTEEGRDASPGQKPDASLDAAEPLVDGGDERRGMDAEVDVHPDIEVDAPVDAGAPDVLAEAACACPLGFDCVAAVCTDRARQRFSPTANPSGNWTWAFHLPAGVSTAPYPVAFTDVTQGGVQVWSRAVGSWTPGLFRNPNAAAVHPYGTFTLEPGELGLHPGPSSENSVLRWTAPATRSYAATVDVRGLSGWNDAQATTTGVTVLHGAAVVGTASLDAMTAARQIAIPLQSFTAGDTLDVRVDFGADGNYGFDATGVDAIVTAP